MSISNNDIIEFIKVCELFDSSYTINPVVKHLINELNICFISYRVFYNSICVENTVLYSNNDFQIIKSFEYKQNYGKDRIIVLKISINSDSNELSDAENSNLTIFGECTLWGITTSNILKSYENIKYYDSLTKLTNVNYFINHLSALLESNDSVLYSVACINIKNCGAINRIFGSDMVDNIIHQFAQNNLDLINESEKEIFSRLSSDSFIIVALTSHIDDIIMKMKSSTVSVELSGDIVEYNVDIRAGIVSLSHNDRKAKEIVHLAEHALVYSRNEIHSDIYKLDSDIYSTLEQSSLTNEIQDALKQNKLQIYYKPSVKINDQGYYYIYAAEAQLRWRTNGEMVNPVELISDLPANSNLLRDLNEYLFRNVCKKMNEWSSQNINTVPVAIEIFAFDYFNTAFADNFIRSIDSFHINRHDIILEFDEKNFHGHYQEMMICVEKCSKAGIRVSVKNYGLGISTLGLLSEIKCHYIKLSPDLINSDSNKDKIILENLTKMILNLGIEVICTDPNSEEIASTLSKYGCSIFQGDIFDKYLSERFFERRLKKPNYTEDINE